MTGYFMQALVILVIFAVYALIIWGLALALKGLGVPARWNILLGFLVFAVGWGLWAALAWPLDTIMLINFPAVMAGETIYIKSIQYLGYPHSSQAHFTIPWLLRVPQVFILASIIVWGVPGLLFQFVRNRLRRVTNT